MQIWCQSRQVLCSWVEPAVLESNLKKIWILDHQDSSTNFVLLFLVLLPKHRRMDGIFFPYQTLVGGAALSALKATEQLHLLNLQISQVFLQFNHLHWYEILVVKFCLNTYTLTCRYYCIICEIVLQDIANNKVP